MAVVGAVGPTGAQEDIAHLSVGHRLKTQWDQLVLRVSDVDHMYCLLI